MSSRRAAVAAVIAVALAIGVVGCIAYRGGRLRPGLALPMSEPPRDPTPTRDPTEVYAPLREDARSDRAAPPRGKTPRWWTPRVQEIAATLAGVAAGGIPLLQFIGTFEENALFEDPVAPPLRDADAGP